MKKICFLVNVDWFFVSHRLPIAIEAIKEGYEVHLACRFTGHKDMLESHGIKCHDIPFSRSGSAFLKEMDSLIKVRKLLKKECFDLLHAITIKPIIYSGIAIKSLKKPPALIAAISGLGYVFSAATAKAALTKKLASWLYRYALSYEKKTVIFQNTSDQSVFSSIIKLPIQSQALIKGSGADLSVYHYKPEPLGDKKVVVMACRLLKEKGVYQFVEAARILKQKHSNLEFWLVGGVDLENPSSIKTWEIQKWVEEGVLQALGHRDDIPRLFSQSHIVTMPSFYGEGVPKVLIEAAASGKPIVTTDNPGCRDAIVDGETGLLVPCKDSVALAEAIGSLLSDESKRDRMGKSAREYAEREFDIRSVVEKHLDIYSSLMANRI